MTDRHFLPRLRAAVTAICAALLFLAATGCSKSSDREIIDKFLKDVNSDTSSSGIYAGELDDGTIYLSMRLKETPENLAKVKILNADESAQQTYRTTVCKSLDEGDVLACLVRQKRSLAFQVEAGEEAYYIVFTPQEIRDIAFRQK